MRLDKLTIKAQEALQAAHELAASRAHQELTPEHVLAALLDQPDGIAGAILRKLGVDPGVERVCRSAAFALSRNGCGVEEIQLDLSAARPAFLSLRGLWFVTHMYSRLDKQDRFGPNVANNVRSGLEVTSKEIAAAEAYRADLCRQYRQLFNEYDHLLTPCVAVPPFPVEQNFPDTIAGKPMKTYIDWIAPTFVLSLTGLPVACVPAGLDATGMPVGLQVAGGHLGEENVLGVAAQIQKLRPVALPRSG